jgi:hypothetical protein
MHPYADTPGLSYSRVRSLSTPEGPVRGYAATLNSRMFPKMRLIAGSGARHMVRYVSRKSSQAL